MTSNKNKEIVFVWSLTAIQTFDFSINNKKIESHLCFNEEEIVRYHNKMLFES